MMNLARYDYFLILDLEATCCDKGTIKRHEMEIIEIGAVTLEAQTLAIATQFQSFIKPVRHPVLTEFCKSLTSITKSAGRSRSWVRGGDRSAETMAVKLSKCRIWFLGRLRGLRHAKGERNQFKQDSKFHNVPFPIAYPHVNLKQRFSDTQGLPKQYGIAKALQLAGIELSGTHHRGIDDARNIAKLLPFILGRQQLSYHSNARSDRD